MNQPKSKWGPSNEEAPLCFQAGIQKDTVNDRRHGAGAGGEKWEVNAKSRLWVPRLVFQATTQRFVEGGDFRVEGTLQNLPPNLLLHAAIISATALNNRQAWSPLPGHPGGSALGWLDHCGVLTLTRKLILSLFYLWSLVLSPRTS